MPSLTPKQQFQLAEMLPRMMNRESTKYFTLLKYVIKSKVHSLPDELVVRPAAAYAHLVPKLGMAPSCVAGFVVPVDAVSEIKDGALVVEYEHILTFWFSATRCRVERYHIPKQRGVSPAAARDRCARYMLELACVA